MIYNFKKTDHNSKTKRTIIISLIDIWNDSAYRIIFKNHVAVYFISHRYLYNIM